MTEEERKAAQLEKFANDLDVDGFDFDDDLDN